MRIPKPLPEIPDYRDPYDLPILQLAVTGKADYLVSSGQDLLGLAGEFVCPIVSADQFMKILTR